MTENGGRSALHGYFHSIRGKLSVLVVCVIIVSTLLLSSILYIHFRSSIHDEVHIELALQGESLREIIRTFISHQQERVDLIISNSQLESVLGDRNQGVQTTQEVIDEIMRILQHLSDTAPELGDIKVADLNGDVVIRTGENVVNGENVSASFVFQEGLRGLFLPIGTQASDLDLSLMSAPIRNATGEVVGVVVLEFDSSSLNASIADLRRPHKTSRIRIATRNADGEGVYLYTTNSDLETVDPRFADDLPIQRALNGEEGFIDMWRFGDSNPVLSAYMPIGFRDWALATQVDAADAYSSVNRTFFVVFLTGLGFATLAVLLATSGVNFLLLPIRRLVDATGEIAGGNYSVRVETKGTDEVGSLAKSFNRMATEIEDYTQTLEQRVERRTRQLEESRDRLSQLVRALEGQADLIQRDMRRAETIQRSLLPREIPEFDGYSIAGTYVPSRNVGGDLFNVVTVDEKHIAFFVADAAGHGAAAALLSVLFKVRVEMPNEPGEFLQPRNLLRRVNESLVEDVSAPGVFVTACLCILNLDTKQLVVVNAGHPPLLIVRAGGQTHQVTHTGPALGLRHGAEYSAIHTSLGEGDSMLMYTDGIFDVGTAKPPTMTELAEVVGSDSTNEAKIQKLLDLSKGDANQRDRDDITFLLLQAKKEDNYLPFDLKLSIRNVKSSKDEDKHRYQIGFYESEHETVLYLANRITWQYIQVFFDAATAVIEEQRPLIIELAECLYMDSSMLGTLHEVVERTQRIGGQITVQNVSDEVERSFVELGLNSVLDVIALEPQTVPPPSEATAIESPHEIGHELRILKAHEALSSINERNKEVFSDVVEEMQEDNHNKQTG